jgi:hypothetical protein
MTKNTLHYNYNATVRELFDLTREEALTLILNEQICAKLKNRAVILTSKDCDEKSGFDAYTQDTLTRNFTWIHFCPQEILNFDDKTPQEEKFYVMIFESVEK